MPTTCSRDDGDTQPSGDHAKNRDVVCTVLHYTRVKAVTLDYKQYAPSAERAHPTDEHFLPLFVALGAAGENYATRVVEGGVTYGVLAMDSYLFYSNGDDQSELVQPTQSDN